MTNNEIRPRADNAEAEETLGGVAFDSIDDRAQTASVSPGQTQAVPRASVETLLQRVVATYLDSIRDRAEVSLQEVRDGVLSRANGEIGLENMARRGTAAPPIPKRQTLDEYTVVKILLARYPIVKIDLTNGHGGENDGVLAIYETDGALAGVYNSSEARLKALISELKPSASNAGVESTLKRMHTHAPVRRRTLEPHLIPVDNGVFDHARQELRPFTKDWVFLSKIQSGYDANAQSPRITQPDGSEWEVEAWFQSLSDDEGVPELLWQVVSAAIRPFVRWDMSAFLIGPKGNGGKGSFVKLLSSLLGPTAFTSIPLTEFGNTFALADLVTKNVNLVDENEVGAFATRLALWKACITGDFIKIEEKYVRAIRMRWFGFEIQCYNEMIVRVKDKSESLARRMLLVPMVKNFKGIKNPDIKDKYLEDPAVLSYVLKRALQMTHTSFDVPLVSQQALDRWFAANNKVVGWWEEHKDDFTWDLLPWAFLYDAYKAWYANVEPSGTVEGLIQFTETLKDHLQSSSDWSVTNTSMRPGNRMSVPELLIDHYKLTAWMNPAYSGADPAKRSMPLLKTNYKGLLRLPQVATAGGKDDDA